MKCRCLAIFGITEGIRRKNFSIRPRKNCFKHPDDSFTALEHSREEIFGDLDGLCY